MFIYIKDLSIEVGMFNKKVERVYDYVGKNKRLCCLMIIGRCLIVMVSFLNLLNMMDIIV